MLSMIQYSYLKNQSIGPDILAHLTGIATKVLRHCHNDFLYWFIASYACDRFLARNLPSLLEILTIQSFWMTIGNRDLKWPGSRVLDVFSPDQNRIHRFIIWYHKENLSQNIRNKYWIRFCYRFDDIGTTQITWLIKMHWKWEQMCTFSMASNSQIHKFVHGKSHTTTE
jgi:hypothetical protein